MSTDPSAGPLADLARHRFDYETAGLDVADVDADPMVRWQRWYRLRSVMVFRKSRNRQGKVLSTHLLR